MPASTPDDAPSDLTSAAAAMDASGALQEAAFQQLADAAPIQIWTAQYDGQLDFVNARVVEYFGRSRERMIGEGWRDVVHATDLPRVLQAWHHALNTGEPYRVEFRLLQGARGLYRWHLGHALAVRDADGRIVRWVGANTDIDDHKRAVEVREAAAELAEAERDRLQRIIAYAPAVMAIYRGPEFVIRVVNRAWEQFTGRSKAIGKRARDVFPEVEEQGVLELLTQVYDTGEPFRSRALRVELDRTGDGALEETFWDLSLLRLDDPRGREHDILVHATEVTEMIRAHREEG